MLGCKVNILGTEWNIEFKSQKDDPLLETKDGYTDESTKKIVVDNMDVISVDSKKNMYEYKKRVVRHEIVHAFLTESGLDGSGNGCNHWELNEEMVDWIAMQFPKMLKAFNDVGAL